MKLRVWATIFFLLVSASSVRANPEQWIQRADQIRNPAESYEMKIRVQSDSGESVFQVYLKGQDRTLIVAKEPARDRGRNMLMIERDFHAYVPNLKRAMKLSLSQKIQGQVANGDISRTRWAGDYRPTLEQESPQERQLLLKGVKPNLTYAWIRLWLSKKDHRPLRAEYLGLNGKTVLKKASFEQYKQLAGAIRPAVIKISDTAGATSYIQIESMAVKEMSDSFFTVRNMETMK